MNNFWFIKSISEFLSWIPKVSVIHPTHLPCGGPGLTLLRNDEAFSLT